MYIKKFSNQDRYCLVDNCQWLTLGRYRSCLQVSSGLPVRNGNKHASEIASMALDLLRGITSFHVSLPFERLITVRPSVFRLFPGSPSSWRRYSDSYRNQFRWERSSNMYIINNSFSILFFSPQEAVLRGLLDWKCRGIRTSPEKSICIWYTNS